MRLANDSPAAGAAAGAAGVPKLNGATEAVGAVVPKPKVGAGAAVDPNAGADWGATAATWVPAPKLRGCTPKVGFWVFWEPKLKLIVETSCFSYQYVIEKSKSEH